MKQLLLRPVDTFFFRNQKDFLPGENSTAGAIFPPRPGTIFGAVRSAYIHHRATFADFVNQKDENLLQWMGTPDKPGKFCLRGCLLYAAGEPVLPLPMDYQVVKDDLAEADSQEKAYCLQLRNDVQKASDGRTYRLYGQKEEKSVGSSGAYLSLDYWKNSLMYEDKLPVLRHTHWIDNEDKLGIAWDWRSKTTIKGKLYNISMSRFKEGYDSPNSPGFLAICADAPDFTGVTYLRVGGKNRPWIMEQLSEPFTLIGSKDETTIINKIKKTGIARLILLSPAIWSDNSRYYLAREQVFQIKPGLKLPIITVVFGRPLLIGGWDIVRNAPKTRFQAVPAGSVLYLKVEPEQVEDLVETLKQVALTDELAYEGYGWAVCGAYNKII